MLALFLILVLPILVVSTASIFARRALPLVVGGFALWLTWSDSHEVVAAIFVGLCTISIVSFLLDRLASEETTRPGVIAIEAVSGGSLAMLAAYAVFGSGGVEGIPLVLAVGVSGLAAVTTALGFRLDRG